MSYRHALCVLHRVQDLKSVASTLRADQEAEVATVPFTAVLRLVGDMTARYPTTHIKISRVNPGGSLEKLLDGRVEIAIATLDGVPLDRIEAWARTSVVIAPVAHPDHPAARGDHLRSDGEMQGDTQVVVADSGQSNPLGRGLMPGGLSWTVSDFAAKQEILLANMGWGGMPLHMVQDERAQGHHVRGGGLCRLGHPIFEIGANGGPAWARASRIAVMSTLYWVTLPSQNQPAFGRPRRQRMCTQRGDQIIFYRRRVGSNRFGPIGWGFGGGGCSWPLHYEQGALQKSF